MELVEPGMNMMLLWTGVGVFAAGVPHIGPCELPIPGLNPTMAEASRMPPRDQRYSNLVIQRSRLLPCAGDQRMRAGKVEIRRNGRPTVDHVAETGNAVLLTAIYHHRK